MKKKTIFILCVFWTISLVLVVCGLRFYDDNDSRVLAECNNKIYIAEKILNVPELCQYPDLPTGCETVSATMVLRYYGVDITATDFADNWLECSEDFNKVNNKLYGPDPNEVFIGSPFDENSYGCYAPVIAKAVNNNSTDCKAKIITDKTLDELCTEFIDNDKPLLIWATMSMTESKIGASWYIEDDSNFTWVSGEHCLVLVGYNEEYYFLNDPMPGCTVAYEKSIVEKRFAELGNQAVYIYKDLESESY